MRPAVFCLALGLLLAGTGQVQASNQGYAVLPGGALAFKKVESIRERRFSGLVQQKTDFSCGAASLATILRTAYHLDVDEQFVIEGMLVGANADLVRTPAGTVADISGEYPDLATVATIAARSYTPDTRFWLHVGRGEDMPGEVITGVPDRRGDRRWWTEGMDEQGSALISHYARLVISRHQRHTHRDEPIPAAPTTHNHTSTTHTPIGGTAMSTLDDLRVSLGLVWEEGRRLAYLLQEAKSVAAGMQDRLVYAGVMESSQDTPANALAAIRRMQDQIDELTASANQIAEDVQTYGNQL